MKYGDILICLNDYIHSGTLFIKNEKYVISSLFLDSKEYITIRVNNNLKGYEEHFVFSLNDSDFYNNFISLKEYRKMKLDKLNNLNEK